MTQPNTPAPADEREAFRQWRAKQKVVANERLPGDDWIDPDEQEDGFIAGYRAALQSARSGQDGGDAGGQLLGYINAGHLHEMRQDRLPYAYLYPNKEVGADVPVYATPPAAVSAEGVRLLRAVRDEMAEHHDISVETEQLIVRYLAATVQGAVQAAGEVVTDADIERIAREHGTGGWQTLADMVRFGRAVLALRPTTQHGSVSRSPEFDKLADEMAAEDPKAWAEARQFARDALTKLAAVSAEGAPQGWRLVPVEPTRDMLNSVKWETDAFGGRSAWPSDMWRDMLAAAPAATVQGAGQAVGEDALLDKILARAQCDSKHGTGFVIGDSLKAKVSVRIWCPPDEAKALISAALAANKEQQG